MTFEILGSVINITSTTVALALAWLVVYFIYKQMQYENAQRRIESEDRSDNVSH